MSGVGVEAAEAYIPTHHSDPYPAIDPQSVKLPKPFVVCIVGASRGIGAGIAYSYAKAGASGLVLASRRISGLEETAAACTKLSSTTEIETIPCDITSATSVKSLAKATKAKFGRLDVLVINSGFSGHVTLKITEADPHEFQQAINVNYVGTFVCAKYFIPLLLEASKGAKAIIGVNSMASLIVRGPIANAKYIVSKTAQARLLEIIHEQHSDEGIKAFAVHPGAVKTEMAVETAPAEFMQYLTDSPDLCGAFCVWLTKERREWLSGRLVAADWDVDELEAKKEQIVEKDLMKLKLAVS